MKHLNANSFSGKSRQSSSSSCFCSCTMLLSCLIALGILISGSGFAQNGNNCNNAIPLTHSGSCSITNFSLAKNNTVKWFKFTAADSSAKLCLYKLFGTVQTTSVTMYSGLCPNLVAIASLGNSNTDTTELVTNGLFPGSEYHIKIEFIKPNQVVQLAICIGVPPLVSGSFEQVIRPIKGCGINYVYKTLKLNQRTAPPTTAGTSLPATFNFPAGTTPGSIPANATLVAAYLWFTAISKNNPASSALGFTLTKGATTIIFPEIYPVKSSGSGISICWGGFDYTASYSIDLTDYIPKTNLPGNYIISDFIFQSSPISLSNFDLNGAVLFLVYQEEPLPCPVANPKKEGQIKLWVGLDVKPGLPQAVYTYNTGISN